MCVYRYKPTKLYVLLPLWIVFIILVWIGTDLYFTESPKDQHPSFGQKLSPFVFGFSLFPLTLILLILCRDLPALELSKSGMTYKSSKNKKVLLFLPWEYALGVDFTYGPDIYYKGASMIVFVKQSENLEYIKETAPTELWNKDGVLVRTQLLKVSSKALRNKIHEYIHRKSIQQN